MGRPLIEPLVLEVAEAQLDDLRERLTRTRWPEAETVDDWSQGIPLAYVQELCAYRASEYDWRRCEARLGTHFPHARSDATAAQARLARFVRRLLKMLEPLRA